MKTKNNRLTVIGGCILLLAGFLASCSPEPKPKKIIFNDFTAAVQKVITYGEDIGNNQKRIKLEDNKFKYCVIVDTKDSSFVVGKARLFGFGAEGWSFSTSTKKLKFFMTKKGEMLDEGKYHLVGDEDPLDPKLAETLRKKFEQSQVAVVNLINKKFGSTTGVSLVG